MRPVVSKCGRFIEIASNYHDFFLKHFIQFVPTDLKNSYTLLHKLFNLQISTTKNLLLFISDTNHRFISIKNFLYENIENTKKDYQHKLIIQLLQIVMKYNIFLSRFVFFLQDQGTAMGTSVACKYATLYFGGHIKNYIIP